MQVFYEIIINHEIKMISYSFCAVSMDYKNRLLNLHIQHSSHSPCEISELSNHVTTKVPPIHKTYNMLH
jgi:hypothetical protein